MTDAFVLGGVRTPVGRYVGALSHIRTDDLLGETMVAGCERVGGFEVPDERLNPDGGAVAIGHPFGSSGTRYVLTLATELRLREARYGVLGVCVGSGQGVAMVLENPNAA
jgi:acetyl-CoA acetyltransferase